MPRSIEKSAEQFSRSLRELVGYNYCLGASSDNERIAATVDFLLGLVEQMYNKITEATIVPAKR